jgi:acyl-CoA thioesterase-1
MRIPPLNSSTRRAALAGGLALAAAPGGLLAAGPPRIVTLLGDSITAGYGLPGRDALPVQLQAALARIGVQAKVRGAGVSGDTMAGGAQRADFSVQSDTDLCVIALGGNDLLQGQAPKAMQASLERIVRRLKQRRIGVLICGLHAPAAVNAGYARAFNAVFPAVASAEHVGLYPNLLAGVQGIPQLNQPDHIHPNAAGARIVAGRLAPAVARALKARG